MKWKPGNNPDGERDKDVCKQNVNPDLTISQFIENSWKIQILQFDNSRNKMNLDLTISQFQKQKSRSDFEKKFIHMCPFIHISDKIILMSFLSYQKIMN